MSVGADELYFLGIPLPNKNEVAFLTAERTAIAEASVDRLSPSYIFNRMHIRNPRIRQFIDYDCQVACSTEFSFQIPEQQDNFRNGLWSGYEFLVGTVEYMYFTRSRKHEIKPVDFEQYLSQMTPESNVSVALMGPDEIKRLKCVRRGKALVDIGQKTDKSSATLAYFDSNELFEHAPHLNDFVEQSLGRNKRHLISEDSGREASADPSTFTLGFLHGVFQAIEMYIQMHEDHVVRKIGVFNQQ